MRRFYTFFVLLLVLISSSCKTASTAAGSRDLNPNEVFTITDDDIANETWRINRTISGQWTYNAPSVDVSGKNVLAGLGKPFAKGKLKKKLKGAFKKMGLNKARPQFTFNENGTCAIKMLGVGMNATYNYNPSQEKITIKWHGIPLTARLKRNGKKLHMTFDTDKLLSLFSMAGSVIDNSTLKALSMLMDNYDDVMVGFELKK